MTTTSIKSRLDPLRDRLRRFQFIVGLGFAALVLGAMIQSAIVIRVAERLEGTSSLVVALLAFALVSRLWVYAVLPLLCYAAARIIPLRPWTTALGGAAVGELFYVALDFVTGATTFDRDYLIQTAVRAVTLALGVVLSAHAVRRGRADAEATREKARVAAEAKKAQYAEFAREAERLAARSEARDQSAAVAGATDGPGTQPSSTESHPTDAAHKTSG